MASSLVLEDIIGYLENTTPKIREMVHHALECMIKDDEDFAVKSSHHTKESRTFPIKNDENASSPENNLKTEISNDCKTSINFISAFSGKVICVEKISDDSFVRPIIELKKIVASSHHTEVEIRLIDLTFNGVCLDNFKRLCDYVTIKNDEVITLQVVFKQGDPDDAYPTAEEESIRLVQRYANHVIGESRGELISKIVDLIKKGDVTEYVYVDDDDGYPKYVCKRTRYCKGGCNKYPFVARFEEGGRAYRQMFHCGRCLVRSLVIAD